MKKLYSFSINTINVIWVILISLTLYFAYNSPNLILGDNSKFGTSTTITLTILILISILFIISVFTFTPFKNLLNYIFVKNRNLTSYIVLALAIIFQIIFVHYVHPANGFDAGMLHYAATNAQHVKEPDVMAYFSLNQNNLPVMLVMHWIVTTFGHSSWEFFDYINLALVDLSVLLNIASVNVVSKKVTSFAVYVQAVGLCLFPSIILSYTDTWVLPWVSGYLLCYFILLSHRVKLINKIIALVLFGPLVVITYFIKPSAIIPVIAMVIIRMIQTLPNMNRIIWKKIRLSLLSTLIILTSSAGTYYAISQTVAKQNYISVDSARNIPAIHFASMGISGDGGYDAHQALEMVLLPNKKAKSDYSKNIIKQRLKELKPWGYAAFLIKKQGNNTADGTFGWLKEGHFFMENQKPKSHGISNWLKNYIYLYGRHIADFRFIAQIGWLAFLIIIGFGYGNKSKQMLMLRLALIGGFMFLLLFEGGRSRYLIQYLPCFIIMASLSWKNFLKRARRINKLWRYGHAKNVQIEPDN